MQKVVVFGLEDFAELAHYYLLTEIPPITQTDIDNGYTQEIHDKIVIDLNTYIVNV